MSPFDLEDPRLPDRFWEKLTADYIGQGCWIWTANTSTSGYGKYKLNRKQCPAHRVAYEALIGPVSDGLELDHRCRTRNCVNPKHMEPVTHRENIRRGMTGRHDNHRPGALAWNKKRALMLAQK